MTNKIDTSFVHETFENHLNLDNNNRIIFSGEFGCGKTTFIKDYFELRSDKYNCFLLSPVKYAVGNNEDIFEYIKFDIIYELMTKYYIYEENAKAKEGLYIWSFINNNYLEVANSFIESIATLVPNPNSEALKASFSVFKNSIEKYKTYKTELQDKLKTNNEVLNDYLLNSISKKGSIFEDDIFTQTIRIYLEMIKVNSGKENILIIDDLDRIDPEHIFRLLNILSIHNDYLRETYSNKFGFDKVIIVCDIDNIKEFYLHKYGSKANFNGYIDKFCSRNFYRFSNLESIKLFCRNLPNINNLETHLIDTLSLILNDLVINNFITLRNLIKYRFEIKPSLFILNDSISISWDKYCKNGTFSVTDKFCIDTKDFNGLQLFSILINILGDNLRIKEIFKSLQQTKPTLNYSTSLTESIVKSLCLLSHFAKCENNPDKLLFTRLSHNDRCNKIHTGYPKTSFAGNDYSIQLQWHKDNKYDGQSSYFDKSILTTQNNSFNLASNAFYIELSIITDFLIDKSLDYKI